MGNIFGNKKTTRITEQDKAVLQLKQQRDKLKQYQKKILTVIEKDKELARKLLREGKKERAKLLLKKKRYQEQLVEKTDKQLDTVEQLVHDLEFAQVEMEVLNSLKTGNESLKEVHKLFSIEDIEQIMEETKEGIKKQKEIDEILAGVLTAEDEEAVDMEFAEIIRQNLPDVPVSDSNISEVELPSVPTEEPKPKKEKIIRKPVPLSA
ncbi:charged multivesicular body protein 6-B-like [Daphnia pulicaria]|uniref:charged multivesicular body protein 6-B-like n=1 Tax=Daphnia pulicaria TaxID=35523 RepID=UPI001EE9B89A|nr:charged multivesicular body protein 6-B-like [Daphnia pulicaria]